MEIRLFLVPQKSIFPESSSGNDSGTISEQFYCDLKAYFDSRTGD